MFKRRKYFTHAIELTKKEFETIINDFIDNTDYTDDVKEKAKEGAWFKLEKGEPIELGNHLLTIKKQIIWKKNITTQRKC